MAPISYENNFCTEIHIKERKRDIFISFFIDKLKLRYGACIFKKNTENDFLSEKEIKYHKNTAYNRFMIRPVVLEITKIIIKEINNNNYYFIRRALCKYGVKGSKILMTPPTTPSPTSLFKEKNICNNFTNKTSIISNNFCEKDLINFKKFKLNVSNLSKRYRYITNERDIFIMNRINDKTRELFYGASIYKKKHSDDRINRNLVEKHYDTAFERLIKCPVKVPYNYFIDINKSYKFNDEDLLFNIASVIINKKNLKFKGEKIM